MFIYIKKAFNMAATTFQPHSSTTEYLFAHSDSSDEVDRVLSILDRSLQKDFELRATFIKTVFFHVLDKTLDSRALQKIKQVALKALQLDEEKTNIDRAVFLEDVLYRIYDLESFLSQDFDSEFARVRYIIDLASRNFSLSESDISEIIKRLSTQSSDILFKDPKELDPRFFSYYCTTSERLRQVVTGLIHLFPDDYPYTSCRYAEALNCITSFFQKEDLLGTDFYDLCLLFIKKDRQRAFHLFRDLEIILQTPSKFTMYLKVLSHCIDNEVISFGSFISHLLTPLILCKEESLSHSILQDVTLAIEKYSTFEDTDKKLLELVMRNTISFSDHYINYDHSHSWSVVTVANKLLSIGLLPQDVYLKIIEAFFNIQFRASKVDIFTRGQKVVSDIYSKIWQLPHTINIMREIRLQMLDLHALTSLNSPHAIIIEEEKAFSWRLRKGMIIHRYSIRRSRYQR